MDIYTYGGDNISKGKLLFTKLLFTEKGNADIIKKYGEINNRKNRRGMIMAVVFIIMWGGGILIGLSETINLDLVAVSCFAIVFMIGLVVYSRFIENKGYRVIKLYPDRILIIKSRNKPTKDKTEYTIHFSKGGFCNIKHNPKKNEGYIMFQKKGIFNFPIIIESHDVIDKEKLESLLIPILKQSNFITEIWYNNKRERL